MIRSGWPILFFATAFGAFPSSRAAAQALPGLDEPASIEAESAPPAPEVAAPPALTLDGGGIASAPRGVAVPPLFIGYHVAAPAAALDPFTIDMALSGPSVPAPATAPSLTFAATSAVAAQSQSTSDPYWGYENQRWGGAGGISFYEFTDAEFRIAAEREEWDSVDRFEFAMYSREPLHGHVEAMIGGFLFWEERDWEEGSSKVLYDTWGFGVDMGAMIYPLPNADQRKVNLGFLPYFRLAMGFGDGDFRNIEVDLPGGVGTASGDMGDLRFDIGAGVEARLVVARTFFAGIGVGYNWWTTAEGAAGTTSQGGTVIIVDDEFDFGGDEAYLRVSAGFFF
jgi:hypothetical protein